ncbi:MAG: tryptophan 7-halogenase [Rubrivivax sp.]|nr:tryptophan 7-halogenase [Rubrivivax sp.]
MSAIPSDQPHNRPPAGARAPVRRVVIAGGGTAGWMVAAGLSKTLGPLLDIKLIESDEIGTVGVGEATIPSLQTFHSLLGIDEQAFMAATQATFKLGIRFESWRDVGRDYFHGFGQTGKDHWTAGFQHFWLKGRQQQLAADYGAYALEAQAAQAGRFAHLPDDGLHYAYHLDATLYARFLRSFSEALGVQRIEGKIVSVDADAQSREIRALQLNSGARLEGDLFIDCTGFRALLIGETLKVDYEDWSHWLFNDSAVAVQTASVGDAVPYTRSIAHPWGWQWRIPLQHRVGNGLVYSSRHVDDEQARQALLAHIEGTLLTQPRVLRFCPGQRQLAWSGNCVAIGLSSGFLEPLESTSIYLIQRAIIRLVQLFPGAGIEPADVVEFNQQTRDDIEHVRDFIVLHYHVTNRHDAPYWQSSRGMPIPASLQHRIDLFRQTGRVFRVAGELFSENSWAQVMLGQGLMPKQHHVVAQLMGDAELARFLDGIRASVDQAVVQMPPHQAYVERYIGSARARAGNK